MFDTVARHDTDGDDPDLSGRRLGDFQLLRRLGRGGMASVYLAEQLSLSRKVAFKVLRSSLAGDAAFVRRFQNEARAAASLVHANIVQIYEVGCIDGVHFIAQEYVPGQNLAQVLARRGAFEGRLAVTIMRQVAAALHRAAEAGIVHRDIKPENIMLSAHGEVKVADFGLARVTSGSGGVNITQVGVTMGTPLYMSPEQVEGRPLGPTSDVYSFGVTCYQMLAGRPPFEGDNALSVAVQHLKSEPERLENLRRDLPEGLCRIVHRMLAKEPGQRFQNGHELLRELRGLPLPELAGEWPSGLEPIDPDELAALAEAGTAATQQLDRLMRSQSMMVRKRVRWGRLVAWAVVAFVGGGLAAVAFRPRSLLESDHRSSKVVKQADARAQYWHAMELGTEPAWLAVEEYFPADGGPLNELYARRAKQQLGDYYLDLGDTPRALALFEELSRIESDVQFQIAGLIGHANAYAQLGDLNQARQKLPRVIQLLPQLQRQNASLATNLLRRLDPRLKPYLEELQREDGGR